MKLKQEDALLSQLQFLNRTNEITVEKVLLQKKKGNTADDEYKEGEEGE